mmetsp:Transcript_85109/g.268448  ORF Transcript_85109/g.268448 Transcript_85109/m.268448 type:complete len:541 (+) Transcript_85109:417-2039(+)
MQARRTTPALGASAPASEPPASGSALAARPLLRLRHRRHSPLLVSEVGRGVGHGHGPDRVPGTAAPILPGNAGGPRCLRRRLAPLVDVAVRLGHGHGADAVPGAAAVGASRAQVASCGGVSTRAKHLLGELQSGLRRLGKLTDAPLRPELRDLLRGEAGLRQHRVRVLTQPRRRNSVVDLGAGELHRRADQRDRLLEARQVHLDEHAPRQDLRVGKDLVRVQDRGAADAVLLQVGQPPGGGLAPGDLVQLGSHRPAMDDPSLHGAEHLVLHELLFSRDLAEALKLLVVRGGQDEVAVFAWHHLVRNDIRVVVANPDLPLLLRKVVHALVLQQGHGDVQHRDVDVLPHTSFRLVAQGGQDTNDGMETGCKVEHREAHLHRLTVGHAGDAHGAAHGLDEHIIGGPVLVGARLAEARDAAVDQAGVLLLQLLVAEPILAQRAGLEVLYQDLAAVEKSPNDLLTLCGREVQGNAVLVAVAARKVRRDFGVLSNVFLQVRRSIAAGVIAGLGPLDLDDRGAHVPHEHRGRGACKDAREVQHAQPR